VDVDADSRCLIVSWDEDTRNQYLRGVENILERSPFFFRAIITRLSLGKHLCQIVRRFGRRSRGVNVFQGRDRRKRAPAEFGRLNQDDGSSCLLYHCRCCLSLTQKSVLGPCSTVIPPTPMNVVRAAKLPERRSHSESARQQALQGYSSRR
jgi:hypothetical protein